MYRRAGGVSKVSVEGICLTVPKNSTGESFSVSSFSGIEKVWRRGRVGGGKYQDFPSKNFCLTVPKTLVGEPFCAVFQNCSGCQKCYG